MKLFSALIIMIVGCGLMILINSLSISNQQQTIEQQQQKIETLTARVLMLENTLSDQSGIKK